MGLCFNTHQSSWYCIAKKEKKRCSARRFKFSCPTTLRRLSKPGEDLKAKEIGLSGVVEDYRTRFVIPCERNANRLQAQARRLKDKFENAMGVNAAQVRVHPVHTQL